MYVCVSYMRREEGEEEGKEGGKKGRRRRMEVENKNQTYMEKNIFSIYNILKNKKNYI